VSIVDGGHAEEHENNRLGRRAQHLHRVLDRRVRLVRDVGLHVVFHRDSAERDPVEHNKKHAMKFTTRSLTGFHFYDAVNTHNTNNKINEFDQF